MSNNVVTLARPEPQELHGSASLQGTRPTREQRSTFAFTENRLALLRATGRDVVHYDTNSPLAVRVTPAGAKTFIVYKWIDGRPVKLRLGRVGEVLLDDARREARRAVAAIAAHRDPAAERKAARQKGMTLAELWDLWKARKWAALRPNRRRASPAAGHTHIEPALGSDGRRQAHPRRPAAAGRQDGGEGQAGDRAQDQGHRHMLLAEAVRLDVVQANAAAGVDAPAYVARARIVLGHEREPLLQSIAEAGEPWADFFLLLMLTGVRVSNMCTMAWADIDLDGRRGASPPGAASRDRRPCCPSCPTPSPSCASGWRSALASRGCSPVAA